MHYKLLILLLGCYLLAGPLRAQCDYQFTQAQMAAYDGDSKFLKNFSVSNRVRSNGTPTTITYSYVMSAGTRYQLQLDTESGNASDWILAVYPSEGGMPIKLQPVATNHGQRFEFDCRQTAIFYMDLTAASAEVGCANLQLRFKQDVPGLVHCSRNYAEELEERRRGEELDFLKTFQVRSNEDPQGRPHFTQFSYILKKGDYYEFQMEDDPVLGTEYEFTLSDDNNEPIPLRKVETETGATYHYLSPSSGVVYLNFHNNQGEAGCASMHLKVETEEDREQRLGRGGQNR